MSKKEVLRKIVSTWKHIYSEKDSLKFLGYIRKVGPREFNVQDTLKARQTGSEQQVTYFKKFW